MKWHLDTRLKALGVLIILDGIAAFIMAAFYPLYAQFEVGAMVFSIVAGSLFIFLTAISFVVIRDTWKYTTRWR